MFISSMLLNYSYRRAWRISCCQTLPAGTFVFQQISSSKLKIIQIYLLKLMSAMVNKLGLQDSPLPQDLEEGVDSDEWVSIAWESFVDLLIMLDTCLFHLVMANR